jgi:hypothetical protein
MKRIPRLFASTIAFAKSNRLLLTAATGLVSLAFFAPVAPAQETPTQSKYTVSEKPGGKAFSTPEAAAFALRNAAEKNDNADMLVILGPGARDLMTWTGDQSDQDDRRHLFVDNYDKMHRLIREPDGTVALYVGPENWPLPIPIVQYQGSWYFDVDLGKQEILYRQVGRNEIESLRTCRALIDAEKEFYSIAHKFTDQFISDPAAHDGLYWKTGDTNVRSPIGPYLAAAGVADTTMNRQPFHGYFYRILLQTPVAPNGDATAKPSSAFVIEAFPAEYRVSGVMTFLMDENGNAYEKDLGPGTKTSACDIKSAQTDQTWNKVDMQSSEQKSAAH